MFDPEAIVNQVLAEAFSGGPATRAPAQLGIPQEQGFAVGQPIMPAFGGGGGGYRRGGGRRYGGGGGGGGGDEASDLSGLTNPAWGSDWQNKPPKFTPYPEEM